MFRSRFGMALLVVLCLCSIQREVLAQQGDKRVANVSSTGNSVRFEASRSFAEATLTVIGPDGQNYRQVTSDAVNPEFKIVGKKGERLPDGLYTYELWLAPVLQAGVKETLAAARVRGDDEAVQRDLRKRGLLPGEDMVQSGSFRIVNGSVVVAGAAEEEPSIKSVAAVSQRQSVNSRFKNIGMKRNHPALFTNVIAEDLVVQGSGCIGLNCLTTEVFLYDTLRLKENNTRIQFDDTSDVGYAANNWQIRANASESGGANFLAIVDQGPLGNSENGTIVFQVDAGAPANSFKVGTDGKAGFRTAAPLIDLHVVTSNTPGIRLEQNNLGGFAVQRWDVGGNEANFFIRDSTGSTQKLPFRIRPGAPTSSIDISAAGNVGIGLNNPIHKLDVAGNVTIGPGFNASQSVPANGLLVQGDVGIGTQTPDKTLTVNGDASKPGGGSWAVYSDERLKQIKGRFNSGLKAVMQLRPLRYEYRRNNALAIKLEGEQIGFSAQEVQKIIPEAVVTNNQGYLLVNNDPIIWTMLNAIKEQQAEIESLKKQIQRLRPSSKRRLR